MNREKGMAKESERIIITAAKLVLSDIRAQEFPSDLYPSEKEIADIDKCESYLPNTLKTFLDILIKRRLKKISIRRSTMGCARPRSAIFPIPLGLGVEMNNQFGSCWLIDELSKLGFSVSYDEVKYFKQSVVEHDDCQHGISPEHPCIIQWIADNIDQSIATLDGKDTFHGMGLSLPQQLLHQYHLLIHQLLFEFDEKN